MEAKNKNKIDQSTVIFSLITKETPYFVKGMNYVFQYIPLMTESVMLFTGDELWSRQMTRTAKYTIHGVVVTVATLLIIGGDGVIFHYTEPGYHLYTAHGITGK